MKALTTLQLNGAVHSKRFIVRRLGFLGTFARDQVPNPSSIPCCVIMNTDPSWLPGEHWIVLLVKGDGTGEFFDSFGLPPSVYDLAKWFPSRRVSYNHRLLQKSDSACGYFCLYYLFHRASGLPLEQISKSLSGCSSDDFVVQSVRNPFATSI